MKKTILTFVATVFLATAFSCSSDDNDGPVDPIAGKWNFTGHIRQGEEITLDDCDKLDFINFTDNNTFEESNSEINTSGNCQAFVYAGTWTKTAERKYTGKYNNDDDVIIWELSEDGKTLTDIEEDQNFRRLLIYTKK